MTVLALKDAAAPPRANGELLFNAPWESRAFGLVVTLHANGAFEWSDFQQSLIAQIQRWESAHPDGEGWSYYTCWLAALEQVLVNEHLVSPGDVERRAAALAERPAGHDHDHAR